MGSLLVLGCGGSPGPGGQAGASGSGGAGAGNGLICFNTSNGCNCFEGQSDPQSPACNAGSVTKLPGDLGVCCQTEDGSSCQCEAYTCINDSNAEYCTCGPSSTVRGSLTGEVATVCPAALTTGHCCYSKGLNSCTCSVLACAGDEVPVTTCALTNVTVCGAGDVVAGTLINSCSGVSGAAGGSSGRGGSSGGLTGGAGGSGRGGAGGMAAAGGAGGKGGASAGGASGSGGRGVAGAGGAAGSHGAGATGGGPSDGGVDGAILSTCTVSVNNGLNGAGHDFDCDGIPDCVVTRFESGSSRQDIALHKGLVSGGFSPVPTMTYDAWTAFIMVTQIADLDGDGCNDVVVWSGPQSTGTSLAVTYIRGQGTGVFALPSPAPTGIVESPSVPLASVLGDFTNDGNPDIFMAGTAKTATNTAQVHWLVFSGSAGPDPNAFVAVLGEVDTDSGLSAGAAGGGASPVGVGDFNGDNKLDVIALLSYMGATSSQSYQELVLAVGDGHGGFTSSSPIPGTQGATSATIDDVNGDGHLDLQVEVAGATAPVTFYGDGTGTFSMTAPAP